MKKAIFSIIPAILWVGLSLPTQAADIKAGKATFNKLCMACHGTSGAGDGPAAAALNPKPKNLKSAKTKGDDYLKKVITQGGASVGLSPTMAPVGAGLSPADLANLIAFIQSL